MAEFEKKFPPEKQVKIENLPDEKQEMLKLYIKAKSLSVGKMSSTEARFQLKGKQEGSWLVRESRNIRGQFVVSRVGLDGKIVTQRLGKQKLSELVQDFDKKFPAKLRIIELIDKEGVLKGIGEGGDLPPDEYELTTPG